MRLKIVFIFLIIALIAGCTPTANENEEPAFQLGAAVEPEPDIIIPEPTRAVEATVEAEMPNDLPPPVVVSEEASADAPVDITPVDVAPTPETSLYKVVDVASDDVLNVRGGPGVDYPIVGALNPSATRVQITGDGELVGSYRWVPIVTTDTAGWVNSIFLAEMSSADLFCLGSPASTLVDTVRTAIETQDGDLLAAVVHPDGLSVSLSWWNPQVNFTQNEVRQLFASEQVIEWGTEMGSGREINGPFNTEILPMLEEDLLAATQTGCNELLAGPTAGIVQLPEAYTETNFFTLHRPAPENGIIFDWGSWVIGLGEANGQIYVRYLMHIEYEI